MIYLIHNTYKNNMNKTLELRNEKMEKIQIREAIQSKYKVGDFVNVDVVNNNKPVIDTKVVKPQNFLDFYPKGLYNKELLKEQILQYVKKIQNADIRIIIDEILLSEEFYLYPAAKAIHHAHIGGLAEHTLSMLKLADAFIENYDLNMDLLYAGIIIHDYGKLRELGSYGLTYTVEGNLLGHLMIGYEIIVNVMNKYDMQETEYTMLLKHMVLAHHGRMDYGSPKEPMTRESYILAQIDEIDAKMNLLKNSLDSVNEGEISNPIKGFDGRRFYKMKGE